MKNGCKKVLVRKDDENTSNKSHTNCVMCGYVQKQN